MWGVVGHGEMDRTTDVVSMNDKSIVTLAEYSLSEAQNKHFTATHYGVFFHNCVLFSVSFRQNAAQFKTLSTTSQADAKR